MDPCYVMVSLVSRIAIQLQILYSTSAIEAAIAEENESDEKESKEKLVLAGLTWVQSAICVHGIMW